MPHSPPRKSTFDRRRWLATILALGCLFMAIDFHPLWGGSKFDAAHGTVGACHPGSSTHLERSLGDSHLCLVCPLLQSNQTPGPPSATALTSPARIASLNPIRVCGATAAWRANRSSRAPPRLS